MRRDEEGDEELVVLVNVPADEPREDDAVPEARDGKELRDALEQAEWPGKNDGSDFAGSAQYTIAIAIRTMPTTMARMAQRRRLLIAGKSRRSSGARRRRTRGTRP